MPVDDAYALESTLSRLRQRYTLYFNLPPGVRAGEERSIEVSLADGALRRYGDGEVRYRRVYLAQNSSAAGPTEVTRAWKSGTDFVKVFPCAQVGGDTYIRAIQRPSGYPSATSATE